MEREREKERERERSLFLSKTRVLVPESPQCNLRILLKYPCARKRRRKKKKSRVVSLPHPLPSCLIAPGPCNQLDLYFTYIVRKKEKKNGPISHKCAILFAKSKICRILLTIIMCSKEIERTITSYIECYDTSPPAFNDK